MSKYLFLLLSLFISGCPTDDRFNIYQVQSKIVDGKVCVFFNESYIVKKNPY